MNLELLLAILSWVLMSLGGLFVLIGGIGVLRMPDLYTRMHAAGVTDSIAPILVIFGVMLPCLQLDLIQQCVTVQCTSLI